MARNCDEGLRPIGRGGEHVWYQDVRGAGQLGARSLHPFGEPGLSISLLEWQCAQLDVERHASPSSRACWFTSTSTGLPTLMGDDLDQRAGFSVPVRPLRLFISYSLTLDKSRNTGPNWPNGIFF